MTSHSYAAEIEGTMKQTTKFKRLLSDVMSVVMAVSAVPSPHADGY